MLPDRRSVLAAARRRVATSIDLVVAPMGGEGACFVSRNELVIARAPKVAVRSTVGAGAALVASLVATQRRGLRLAETARVATAFSVDAVTHVGSDFSSPAAIDGIAQRTEVRWSRRQRAEARSRRTLIQASR